MDINIIEASINQLENNITSPENVQELANLYIVRDNLLKKDTNTVEQELNDILPMYKKYCETKKQYQLKQIPEDAVIHDMTVLCEELNEFIRALYSSTDFFKERRILVSMLESLHF